MFNVVLQPLHLINRAMPMDAVILLQGLLQRHAVWPAVLISSALFGVVHTVNGPATGDFSGALWQAAAAATQGAAAKKLSGKIKGYGTVEYSLAVPAGGELGIKLSSANPSAYFNISLEGADEALFVGSRDGQRYQAKVTAAGRYKVSVYLMRNAARKNQAASYLLEIASTGS